jgi:CHAD domain-containing protein
MKKKLRIRWENGQGPAENARRVLPDLARQYFALGKKAAGPKISAGQLHQFRLATKRFRYSLELFVPVYGPGLEARLKQVRLVQQVLGEVQDCEAVRAMEPVRAHKRVLALVEQRMTRKIEEYRRLWRREFSGEAAQRRWLTYLERYAKERSK